jgi:hypothetical protein
MKLSAVSSLSAVASTTVLSYEGQLPEEKKDGRAPNYLVLATHRIIPGGRRHYSLIFPGSMPCRFINALSSSGVGGSCPDHSVCNSSK